MCQGKTHMYITHVEVDGTKPDVEPTFCYLGDMLSTEGGFRLG